jgi:hypothetical protein
LEKILIELKKKKKRFINNKLYNFLKIITNNNLIIIGLSKGENNIGTKKGSYKLIIYSN